MKIINIGILAHVDAGKTTLSEALLYVSGSIRKFGRVDHRDTFLDTFSLERERGITIFSKQAKILLPNMQINLLDTPGHTDFSAELERSLAVLDYAIIVVSAIEGVQNHTSTVWRLLKAYNIPAFIFINKTDYEQADKERIYEEIRKELDENIVDFTAFADSNAAGRAYEELSYCDEKLMDEYIRNNRIKNESIAEAIFKRKIFPCIFGSALKLQGIEELLGLLSVYTNMPVYAKDFGAIVYKINRDDSGAKLCHLKITGGILKTRMQIGEEKINQIRIYNGEKYECCNELAAGNICAVTGLDKIHACDVLGVQPRLQSKVIEPVLNYDILIPENVNMQTFYKEMQLLAEEEPQLCLLYDSVRSSMRIRLFGAMQTEILQELIRSRTGVEAEFLQGSVIYKESIENTVEGVGHYEPVRHYAEVHLLMEPAERGSGLVFENRIFESRLSAGWQKNILSHLKEKNHVGVLGGFPITDMKISLVAGRADNRHTDGGDFKEAAFRALRQGLMQARSILLEPYYLFTISLPRRSLGRALSDLGGMYAKFDAPKIQGEEAVIEGYAPVACIQNYQAEIMSYTAGEGRISFSFKGYDTCHNTEEVLEERGYEPDADEENPSGSIFCVKGSGFYVPWEEVFAHMHLDSYLESYIEKESFEEDMDVSRNRGEFNQDKAKDGLDKGKKYHKDKKEEEDLLEIFERTYGKIKPRIGEEYYAPRKIEAPQKPYVYKEVKKLKEYILVDGYNVIFAWKELNELAKVNIDAARSKLADILCNYQGYIKSDIILVFDAYKVEGHKTEIIPYQGIYIVYTKQAETADQYIEKTVHEMSKNYNVSVITSDATEQVIIRSKGCRLMSSREFEDEIGRINEEIRKNHLSSFQNKKNYLLDGVSEEVKAALDKLKFGKDTS